MHVFSERYLHLPDVSDPDLDGLDSLDNLDDLDDGEDENQVDDVDDGDGRRLERRLQRVEDLVQRHLLTDDCLQHLHRYGKVPLSRSIEFLLYVELISSCLFCIYRVLPSYCSKNYLNLFLLSTRLVAHPRQGVFILFLKNSNKNK